jgi:glyoxylase-like metal-dependent hydrolase (beta-lactamase superfamily II)
VTEVIPGIHQLKIPFPKDVFFGYVNTYIVQGDSGYLLVDTGLNTEEAFNSLERQLTETGINAKAISQIVVTHIHPDHYGLAGRLKQISGANIAMHYLEKDLIDSRYVHMDALLRQVANWLHINGVPDEILLELQIASVGMAKFVSPAMPDTILHGGETISNGFFSFKVLWTAGHSPGHISLYEPNKKILISGDHILPTITPNIGLHPQSGDNPLDDYLDALKAIKKLDVKIVLPGHENPFAGLESRIAELLKHHTQRKTEILHYIETEPKTACQIASKIPWMLDMGAPVGKI